MDASGRSSARAWVAGDSIGSLIWRKDVRRPRWPRDLRQNRSGQMNGAQSLVQTLVNCGVDTCFANPGTSEMHLVAALDTVKGLRPVLCLFEGVATGAADGYGRIA